MYLTTILVLSCLFASTLPHSLLSKMTDSVPLSQAAETICSVQEVSLTPLKPNRDAVECAIRELITFLEVPAHVPLIQAPQYVHEMLCKQRSWVILSMLAIEGVSIVQKMYADSRSREYARDILRELIYQIGLNNHEFMMRSQRITDFTQCAFPPLLKQLHDSCFIVGEKSLLATAIELGNLQDIDLILRCQGLNTAL